MKTTILALAALMLLPLTAEAQRRGRGPRGQGRTAVLRQLDLTPAQRKQVTTLRLEHQKKAAPVFDKLAAKRTELRRLWNTSQPDRRAILAMYAQMDRYRSELRRLSVDFRLALYGVLTDVQRKKMFVLVGQGQRGQQGQCGGFGRGWGRRGGGGDGWWVDDYWPL